MRVTSNDIELPANFVIPFFLYLIRSFILALSSLSPVIEWKKPSLFKSFRSTNPTRPVHTSDSLLAEDWIRLQAFPFWKPLYTTWRFRRDSQYFYSKSSFFLQYREYLFGTWIVASMSGMVVFFVVLIAIVATSIFVEIPIKSLIYRISTHLNDHSKILPIHCGS